MIRLGYFSVIRGNFIIMKRQSILEIPMSKESLKVLLIEGNARQVLPMARAMRELGVHVITYNTSCLDFGYASRYPNKKILAYANKEDEEGTLKALINELTKEKYDLIVPMNDDIAILLSKHKPTIEQYASVAVNDWERFKIASDKLETMRVCMENGIPCPKTALSYEKYVSSKHSFQYPLVVKPRTGCGAVGFYIAKHEKDLKEYYELAEKKYGKCLIQEYIPQTDLQYKAELYIDGYGDLKSAVVFAKVRWYPVDGGSSTLNKTVDRPDIIESCRKLLQSIGWFGYADIDLIQDPRDNIAKIIEINPRITGSVKICFKAGVNFAQQILEDYSGKEVTLFLDYKKDIYLRYFQKDLLWLLKSDKRFKSKPSWFNFKNNVDQIFDIKDPLPFILSSFDAIPKLIKYIKNRKISK